MKSSRGLDKIHKISFSLFLKIGRNEYADFLNQKGKLYLNGDSSKPEFAFEHFMKAASLDHPNATYNLATCYEEGLGVQANEKRAKYLYKRAIELGEPNIDDKVFPLETPPRHEEVEEPTKAAFDFLTG